MLKINLMAALTLALIGCGAANNQTASGNKEINFRKIECPAFSTHSTVEQRQSVIKNAQEFVELFLTSDLDNQDEMPEINFNENVVLAIHLGPMPSSGYIVDAKEVIETDGVLNVKYEVVSPNQGCNVDTAITYPYCFIEIKKSNKEIVFSAINSSNCSTL